MMMSKDLEKKLAGKKYDIDLRGDDVKVISKFWFGPWHSIRHGVYTMDGVLIGLFDTYSQVLDFVLKARHRVVNMRSLLLQAADECRWLREWSNFLNEPLNKKG